jgi:hypothetical protein
MHLSLTLLTRPGRAAAIVAVVGLLAVAQGAIALRWQASGHGWDTTGLAAVLLLAAALAASVGTLGALVPLVGRRGRLGLGLARAGVVLMLVALVASELGAPTGAVVYAGLGIATVGMWLVSGAVKRAGELGAWTPAAATAGFAAAAVIPAGGAIGLGLAWLAVAGSIWSAYGLDPEPTAA